MAVVVSRFEIYLVRLDPTEGREIRKTRPCLVISPDEMNHHIDTVIVAPMTTKGRLYPTRVSVEPHGFSLLRRSSSGYEGRAAVASAFAKASADKSEGTRFAFLRGLSLLRRSSSGCEGRAAVAPCEGG